MKKLAFALLACVLAASAAGIEGSWNAQLTGKKAANTQTQSFTLSLKTQDGQLTGVVTIAGKKKPRLQNIQNARLDGNTLTFTTVQATKKATTTFSWQATVEGGQMSGTRTREGAKHGVPFKAQKAG